MYPSLRRARIASWWCVLYEDKAPTPSVAAALALAAAAADAAAPPFLLLPRRAAEEGFLLRAGEEEVEGSAAPLPFFLTTRTFFTFLGGILNQVDVCSPLLLERRFFFVCLFVC